MQYIKIPNNINVLYNQQKSLLICKNKTEHRLLNLNIKILINKNKLFVTNESTTKLANNQKKQLNSLKGLVTSQIKQIIMELTITSYQKLKFVGVGYRAIKLNQISEKNIFLLKLGLSHPLYLSANCNNINLFCLKFTKLFIFGNFYQKVSQITSNIRLKKWPEPYKGKGILFNNEKIKLKEGKKI